MRQISKQVIDNRNEKNVTTTNCDHQQRLMDYELNKNLLNELEFLKEKILILERDLQTLLMEKDELQLSRHELQEKNDQLNQRIISMMKLMPNSNVNNTEIGTQHQQQQQQQSNDLDALYMENRYHFLLF